MIKLRGNSMLHHLDRYGGIPAIVVLGHMRRKRAAPSTIQTIGLLKLGAIGDTVLMSAVIADLRHAFPNASITFFSGESNFEIADPSPSAPHRRTASRLGRPPSDKRALADDGIDNNR